MASVEKCFLNENEAKRLASAKTKSEKEEKLNALRIKSSVKNVIIGREDELGKILEASKGVCQIDVGLELELEKSDMDDALELGDADKIMGIFPALTKLNTQRLLQILKQKQTQFEQTVAEGNPIVVEMQFRGMGVHCGEGWVVADQRLLKNLTQISNATFTFIVEEGGERKEIKFEPVERLSFHVNVKESALETLSAIHPNLTFVKLGLQSSNDNPQINITEWEATEQKKLDEAKFPEFRLPLFNDLEIGKKFSIVQFQKFEDDEKLERIVALVDDTDIVPDTGNKKGKFFMRMSMKHFSEYAPSSAGGISYSVDGDLFTMCGLVLSPDDGLLLDEALENPPLGEFLPFHGDVLTIFVNAKNFLYNRVGQALTEGQSIMYNYQMMAEFAKDLLIKSLGSIFNIQFVYPIYDEKFTTGHGMDVTGYFANEATKS